MAKFIFYFRFLFDEEEDEDLRKKIAKKENERKDFNGISWCCSLVWPCTISAPSGHWWATYTECYTAGKHLKVQLDVGYDQFVKADQAIGLSLGNEDLLLTANRETDFEFMGSTAIAQEDYIDANFES